MSLLIENSNKGQQQQQQYPIRGAIQRTYTLRECFVCNEITRKVCQSCKKVAYCSLECQSKDWVSALHNSYTTFGVVGVISGVVLYYENNTACFYKKKKQI
jgi:MYND finger